MDVEVSEMTYKQAGMVFTSTADPFVKLPALAERLGVAQVKSNAPPSVHIVTADGKAYDLFDLVNAFLDRLDEGSGKC